MRLFKRFKAAAAVSLTAATLAAASPAQAFELTRLAHRPVGGATMQFRCKLLDTGVIRQVELDGTVITSELTPLSFDADQIARLVAAVTGIPSAPSTSSAYLNWSVQGADGKTKFVRAEATDGDGKATTQEDHGDAAEQLRLTIQHYCDVVR